MDPNKKKNIAAVVTTVFLFLALFNGWPYGFFTLLRFVVFAATAYIAWMAYEQKKREMGLDFWFSRCSFQPIYRYPFQP